MESEKLKYLIFICAFCVLHTSCSKYAKDGNAKESSKREFTEERHFRSKKANLIWEKAQRTLQKEPVRLDALYASLKSVDDELMKLKVIKHNNEDPFGELENSINEKVDDLLRRYDLSTYFEKQETSDSTMRSANDLLESRLQAIVDKAKDMGFTEDEMSDLKTEISHHRRKMAEIRVLEDQLDRALRKMKNVPNEIDSEKSRDAHVEVVKSLKLELKDKQKDLHSGITRLSLLSEGPMMSQDVKFTETRILQLWSAVLRANFTEEERASLKEELTHLERKMQKKDKYGEHMSIMKKKAEEKQRRNMVNHDELAIKKHEEIKAKVQHLDKHVKKQTKDIEYRISSRLHTEL